MSQTRAAWFWELLFALVLVLTFTKPGWLGNWKFVVQSALWLLLVFQSFTVIDLFFKQREANKVLRDVLIESQDDMEDTLREPNDNRPYARYMGRMTPQDQAKYNELYKDVDKCEKCKFPLWDPTTGGGSNMCLNCGHINLEEPDGRKTE